VVSRGLRSIVALLLVLGLASAGASSAWAASAPPPAHAARAPTHPKKRRHHENASHKTKKKKKKKKKKKATTKPKPKPTPKPKPKPKPKPTPTPPPATSPSKGANWGIGGAALTPAERQDFDAVNADRAMAAVGPLQTSSALEAIANKRATLMAQMNSDYAGYDVVQDIKAAGLCATAQMEIEDQLQGGGGSYPEIELNPEWTVFAVAIVTNAVGTYEVEDYAEPCGSTPQAPLTLPQGSVTLQGLAVAVGPPSASATLYPLGSTITDPSACNPAAGLYAVVSYSGSSGVSLTGESSAGATIDQPATPGTDDVLLGTDLSPGDVTFEIVLDASLTLPDGDAVSVQLPGAGVGGKLAAVLAPSC